MTDESPKQPTEEDPSSKVMVGDISGVSGGEISIAGRDIIRNIQNIYERALTAVEEAEQARAIESRILAQGVGALAQRLQAMAGDITDADQGGPYRGLLAYRLSDAEIFFGREQAISELFEHLQRARLTVLHSESGAGKTSLVQAGIAPRLIARGHLPLYLRPYDEHPAVALKRAFIPDLTQSPLLAGVPLRDFTSRVAALLGPDTGLYIFLDQFEEFFSHLPEEERADFVRQLAECLEDESLNVHWILALRTEYFGNLANFRPRIRSPFENDYRLNRLTRSEAQDVITRPAAMRGLRFENGLISRLLDDLGKDQDSDSAAVAPPQLQLVCSGLYRELPPGETVITHHLYEAQGGAAGILSGYLERVLSRDLKKDEREAARRLLETLITADVQRVIRTHTELVADLSHYGVTPQTLEAILEQLVDSRLLRVEETDQGLAYELAHDYLVSEIQLDPEVQARKAAQELLEQEVRAFKRHQTLLTAERLAVIAPYRGQLSLTPDAVELLERSQQEAEREKLAEEARRQKELDDARRLAEETEARREAEAARAQEAELAASRLRARNRIITMVGGLAVVLFVVAVLFAINSRLQADRARYAQATAQGEAQSRAIAQAEALIERDNAEHQASLALSQQLAAQAQGELRGQFPERSVLLALEALTQYPYTRAAEVSLADAVQRNRLRLIIDGSEEAHWSPDGARLLVAGDDQTVRILQADTRVELLAIPHAYELVQVSWSPDGSRILALDSDGVEHIWDASTGKVRISRFHLPNNLYANIKGATLVAWSPDGRRIARIGAGESTLGDNKIVVWDTSSGNELLRIDSDKLGDVAWSPDGTRLLTAHPLGGCCGMISVWDARTGELLMSKETIPATAIAWSPDGSLIAMTSAFKNSDVYILDPFSGEEQKSIGDSSNHIDDIAWSPEGLRMALVSQTENVLEVWETLRARRVFSLDGAFGAVEWSPDGTRLLVSNSATQEVWMIDATRGPDLAAFPGGTGAAWSPDGQRVLTISIIGDISLWDVSSLEQLPTPLAGRSKFYNDTPVIGWSPDGNRVAVTDGFESEMFDARTGTTMSLEPFSEENYLVWSPNWGRVARIDDEGIKILDASSGSTLLALPGETSVRTVMAWSRDETRLATATANQIKIWDANSGAQLITLSGHADTISSISWSPDGTRLVSTSGFLGVGTGGFFITGDKTIRVWELATGSELFKLLSPLESVITAAHWSPDGRFVLLQNPLEESTYLRPIWQSVDDLVRYARQCCAVRALTPEERSFFNIPDSTP